jgi:hypothetical protein
MNNAGVVVVNSEVVGLAPGLFLTKVFEGISCFEYVVCSFSSGILFSKNRGIF